MATPSVRMTIQIPSDLYEWLAPLIAKRAASQFIVELLEKARAGQTVDEYIDEVRHD